MEVKVTIKDIAQMAGVSTSTVSRVLSDKSIVNKKTAQRVKDAIEAMGYQPNYTARALATSLTNTIAVLIDRTPELSLNNAYFVDVLEAIATALSKYEKDMLLVFSDENKNNTEDKKITRLIKSQKIDGVIKLSALKGDKTLEFLKQNLTPTVVIGNPEDKDIMYVDNDNIKAMQKCVSYLLDRGNQKIAFVGGSPNYIVTQDRKLGYCNALNTKKLNIDENDIYFTEFTIEAGYQLADELLKNRYDAIACTDDLIAVGISKRLLELNLKMDITGFNNTYYTEISKIPISTVDISAKKLGENAVKLLINSFKGETQQNHIIVDTNLIKRN